MDPPSVLRAVTEVELADALADPGVTDDTRDGVPVVTGEQEGHLQGVLVVRVARAAVGMVVTEQLIDVGLIDVGDFGVPEAAVLVVEGRYGRAKGEGAAGAVDLRQVLGRRRDTGCRIPDAGSLLSG